MPTCQYESVTGAVNIIIMLLKIRSDLFPQSKQNFGKKIINIQEEPAIFIIPDPTMVRLSMKRKSAKEHQNSHNSSKKIKLSRNDPQCQIKKDFEKMSALQLLKEIDNILDLGI